MRLLIFAVSLAASVPVSAQVTSTTNCLVNGRYVNCTTQTLPDYMGNFQRGVENMQQQLQAMSDAAERKKAAEAYERTRIQQSNRAYVRQRVGELAAAGNCVNARQFAVAHGEFQLHAEVDTYCKQREGQQEPAAQAVASSASMVPNGVLLNRRTDLGNGKMKCEFANGLVREISSDGDCFKP